MLMKNNTHSFEFGYQVHQLKIKMHFQKYFKKFLKITQFDHTTIHF